ncbi:MAG: class I SAM-dependent methyltransferase [Chitinophagaceae bacterium]|nr:class I SAM-dependent methyltransferase [Chitinophagaceae bacterium]
MEKTVNEFAFLDEILVEIGKVDKLHIRKVEANVNLLKKTYSLEYNLLLKMIYEYYRKAGYTAQRVSNDYMSMVRDMRKEGLYFYKNNSYSCKSQVDANEKVYSKPEVMEYYMSALLISQILWKHHFVIFIYFKEKLASYFEQGRKIRILDVGPGHGFFSFFVKETFPDYDRIDFVDISATSLNLTKNIIGSGNKLNYYLKDIFEYEESNKYDFIILGEVIEHLDEPKKILSKLGRLLGDNGIFWITTPTNSPALDHVYLFRSKEEVFSLVEDCGLVIEDHVSCFAEEVSEEVAIEKRITNLVGLFCKNKTS